MSVLYITQDGVTDHIGRSQVAPYVLGLARQGHSLHVLSAEKPGREKLIHQYQQMFDTAGVRWSRVIYRNRPPLLAQAWTQRTMYRVAQRIIKQEKTALVHCRSFPAALLGYSLKHTTGAKYLFDFRDFYADGGLAKTRGVKRLIFRWLKHREGTLLRHADGVVCLTERAVHLLDDWYFGGLGPERNRFQVVPCCADFNHFDPATVGNAARHEAQVRAGLKPGTFVLLYLGSLGPDYLLPQMLALFRQVLAVRPDATFLFLSNNGEELVASECEVQGIPRERVRFVSADRQDVPAYISLANLSVVFIRPDVSKAGCSPTKLAELFACNVPVIANTGVGDMDRIIDPARNGSVIVDDFSDDVLRGAVCQVLDVQHRGGVPIRENSRDFSLEEGIARYAALYRRLMAA